MEPVIENELDGVITRFNCNLFSFVFFFFSFLFVFFFWREINIFFRKYKLSFNLLFLYNIRINNRISATKLKFNCYNEVVSLNIEELD